MADSQNCREASKFPRFRVFKIESQLRWGILVEKRSSPVGTWENGYFYLTGDTGLHPTEEILVRCGSRNCHPLEDTYSRGEILRTLAFYCEEVEKTGAETARPKVQFPDISRGLCIALSDLKNRFGLVVPQRPSDNEEKDRTATCKKLGRQKPSSGCPFYSFIGNREHFKTRILHEDTEGYLSSRSDAFGVLAPEEVLPDSSLDLLRPISEVLLPGPNEKAEWFRSRGPSHIDFEAGRAYERVILLEQLESYLNSGEPNHRFHALFGVQGSGKTFLALHLAYKLHTHYGQPVYYFSYRPFDSRALVREICAKRGVHILDDIHLAPGQFDEVYCRLRDMGRNRCVLLVGRLPDGGSHNKYRIYDLPRTVITGEDAAPGIIEAFFNSRHNGSSSLHLRFQQGIYRHKVSDLVMLGAALRGCCAMAGEGTLKQWMAHGARTDLNAIAYLNRLPNPLPDLPKIVVALAALYRFEVLTAQRYLTKTLKIDPVMLDFLVKSREIRRIQQGDHVYYGLYHASRAEAYWAAGEEYKDAIGLPHDDEGFVYDYAISGAPNGLRAIQTLNFRRSDDMINRLRAESYFCNVLKQETSFDVIGSWIESTQSLLTDELEVIAHKLDECSNLSLSKYILGRFRGKHRSLAPYLWQRINKSQLADRIKQEEDHQNVASSLWAIARVVDDVGPEFLLALNPTAIVERVKRVSDLTVAGWCLGGVLLLDKKGRRVLLEEICSTEYLESLRCAKLCSLSAFLEYVSQGDADCGKVLLCRVGVQVLVEKVVDPFANVCEIVACIQWLSWFRPILAEYVIRRLDPSATALKWMALDSAGVYAWLSNARRCSPDLARIVCNNCPADRLVQKILEDSFDARFILRELILTNGRLNKQVVDALKAEGCYTMFFGSE